MKTTPLRLGVSLIALLHIPSVIAEPTVTATTTTTTTTSEEPSCTASLITTLCDYPEPFIAAASSGKAYCWDYCNENPPCDFVIFAAGNPYTGTGTCWVYPGETFDEAKGTTDGCSNPYLSVYGKPECKDDAPSATVPGGGCAATASPSAVASVCGYPPPDDCFDSCKASSGAVNCLSLCAESEACSYAVFNPLGTNSPYAPGNCWIFADGEYDAGKAGTCGSESPKQYVYNNVCPKPSTVSSSSPSATSGSDGGSATKSDNASATGQGDKVEAKNNNSAASAPVALSLSSLLAVGLVIWL